MIPEVVKEQDARDLPDIVAEEEAGNRRYDNKEQGIEAAGSAFDVDGPGERNISNLSAWKRKGMHQQRIQGHRGCTPVAKHGVNRAIMGRLECNKQQTVEQKQETEEEQM